MKSEEWQQIDQLLIVLKSFSQLTNAIDTTCSVSIHEMFCLYNWIFEQLNQSEKLWKADKQSWHVGNLLKAIAAAKKKLREYYSATENSAETFYNLKTILNSAQKLDLYKVCNLL